MASTQPEASATPDPNALPTTPEARAEYVRAALAAPDFKALYTLFLAEVKALPAFATAMANYFPGGHEFFANQYASTKAALLLKGPFTLEKQERHFLYLRRSVAERLWEIQQKKLFDLQCQWRAGQLTLPGVRHSHDFAAWGTHIDACPWLPPLTAADIACYQAYLRHESYEYRLSTNWQDYERFQRHLAKPDGEDGYDEDGEDAPAHHKAPPAYADYRPATAVIPAWYTFHDAYLGQQSLLALPDVRGPREEYYMNLWRAENQTTKTPEQAHANTLPWPPISGRGDMKPWLTLFEPAADLPRLLRLYEATQAADKAEDAFTYPELWLNIALKQTTQPWPIAAHADWRVAVCEAGLAWWCQQAAAMLPELWQEHEQNRDLNLPVVLPNGAKHRPAFATSELHHEDGPYSKGILRGRELAGEPRTFDF